MTAGTAVKSPAAVVIRASAMPGATARKLAAPAAPRPVKASITPQTVPNRPINGVTEPVVASQGTYLTGLRTRKSQVVELFPPQKRINAPHRKLAYDPNAVKRLEPIECVMVLSIKTIVIRCKR